MMKSELEGISDLAQLAMPQMVAEAAEEEEEQQLEEEILGASSAELEEGGRSRPRALSRAGAARGRARIPSSSPETEDSSSDDDDCPRIVRMKLKGSPSQPQAPAAAAGNPRTSTLRAASPSAARQVAQQGVGNNTAKLALQGRAAQGVQAAEPAAGNYPRAKPGVVGAPVASHKRARRQDGSEDQRESTKRARKRPESFVAEPASGKLRHDDAAKTQDGAQTTQRTAKPRRQMREADDSGATLAGLKDEYLRVVRRPATGRHARNPDWLREKIAEATSCPTTRVPAPATPVPAPGNATVSKPVSNTLPSVPATKAAKPTKQLRELRDWLFLRQLGSIADALIEQGFDTLKDLIEAELTQQDVEDEELKLNMYARKRLLRELEYETKSRSIAVAVGSPPISRPEEHAETVANGTAVPAGTTLSEAEKDEEPDAEDMPLSDDDGSSDEDDDRNIYDPAESIASHTYRPNNKKCSRSPGQSRIRPPAASSTKGNQPILKDDTDEKNV
eukprot:COSAG02_NODE_9167_length_2304_cov_5.351020_1_plen_504_part_01